MHDVIGQQRDAAPGGEITTCCKLVLEREAVGAAVPIEVVVARDIDDRDADEAVGQPRDRRRQPAGAVAGDDRDVERRGDLRGDRTG